VGAEALEQPPAARGPGDAADAVTRGQQFAHGAVADDAGGSGDHDGVHDQVTGDAAGS
jgi:hypothetical protein